MNMESLPSLIPLWAVFIFTILVVVFSLWLGFQLGDSRRRSPEHESAGSIGPVGGALLGLLAFLLAFTFGIAWNRFDTRKALLLDEVNAIGTAYLRAELIPAPHGPKIRKSIREYVDLRAGVSSMNPEQLANAMVRADELLDKLWAQIIELAEQDQFSRTAGLLTSSLNEVIDFNTKRITVGLQYRIPPTVWTVFYVLSVFTMVAVGYQFGLAGKSSRFISAILALAFSVVILLIADLDRSTKGTLTVSQQPMIDLQHRLHKH